MNKEYKICEFKDGNGKSIFRAKTKGWLWGWNYVVNTYYSGGGGCWSEIKEWKTREEAEYEVRGVLATERSRERHLVECK